MNTQHTEQELAALAILKQTGVNILEAAHLAYTLLKSCRRNTHSVLKYLAAGKQAIREQKRTVHFEQAVNAALEDRQNRRKRTIYDFRYFTRRFMKRCPDLKKRKVRSINPQECAAYIRRAFDTPRQQQKARLILSGVFSTAVKRGWCKNNPAVQVVMPKIQEQTIPILSSKEIAKLLKSAKEYRGGTCQAAVGIMLYAGIRPQEITRLTWDQVDLQQHAIYILPQHSKTGGARRVSIHPPLLRILQQQLRPQSGKICPPNWLTHWRRLRYNAGWNNSSHPWPQDALRHTFASYHLCHFRSYSELQCEIGHRDSTLLRTRYLNMNGVENAASFWLLKDQRKKLK